MGIDSLKEIGIFLLIFLIGGLTSLYLAGKLVFWCVRLFRDGHVTDALWLAAALCAAIGFFILNSDEKSFFITFFLVGVYAVIRGFWVFLHWLNGIPVGSLDNRDRGVNDGVNESGVSHDIFRRKDRDWMFASQNGFTVGPEGPGFYLHGVRVDSDLDDRMFDSQNGLTVGPEGPGLYSHGVRVDSDLGIDHGNSFDNRW